MPKTQQHNSLLDLAKSQLETTNELANAIFSGVQKIDHALLDVAHQMLDAQRKFGSVAVDMRDQSRLVELRNSVVGRPDIAMQCHQQIMSAVTEIQVDVMRCPVLNCTCWNKNSSSLTDDVAGIRKSSHSSFKFDQSFPCLCQLVSPAAALMLRLLPGSGRVSGTLDDVMFTSRS